MIKDICWPGLSCYSILIVFSKKFNEIFNYSVFSELNLTSRWFQRRIEGTYLSKDGEAVFCTFFMINHRFLKQRQEYHLMKRHCLKIHTAQQLLFLQLFL